MSLSPTSIFITCTGAARLIFCEALKNYAHEILTEHRPGQFGASHHQLLELIQTIEQTPDNQPLQLDENLQRTCLSAIHFHYSRMHQRLNAPLYEQKQVLLDMMQGEPACDKKLERALVRDSYTA